MMRSLFLVLVSCFLSCNSLPDVVPWAELVPATKISFDVFSASKSDALNEAITGAWMLFKANFRPKYLHNTEHDERFKIFSDNFIRMFLHNRDFKLGKVNYTMGINHLSDRTAEELKHMRCLVPFKNATRHGVPYVRGSANLPEAIDWRQKNAVTDVKNQGQCGSCWAFSSTGAIEGQYARKTKHLLSFSEQQLVDCSLDYGNNACQGGLMDNAFNYIKESGGITTEEQYPYVSGETGEQNPKCHSREHKAAARVTGYTDIAQFQTELLQHAVAFEGPISIAINAGLPSFPSYHSGVYSDALCSGDMESLDHGVLLVGYGEENGVPYWLVKNSWGEMWGEQGYVKILRNSKNMCGVASLPSYPTVEPVN